VPTGLTIGSTAVGFGLAAAEDYRGVYTGVVTTTDRNGWLSRLVGTGVNPSSWTINVGSSPTQSFGTTLSFASAAPTITSLGTTSGPAAGGTTVVITGTNLSSATGVKFGANAATGLTANTATSITATAPAGTGTVDITVTTAGGTSATSAADQFTYIAAPTITSLGTTSGPTAGGTSVAITGTGFTGATAVKFGTTSATGFTVNSATSITATAPAGSAGTVDITVVTVGGTSATSAADQFTYVGAPTVTSLGTTSGPTAGGTSVVITGTNFTGATAVKFGANGSMFAVNSATQITVTAPAGSAGTVDVTVVTAGGTSATSAADQFTYVGAPTVTSLATTSGPTAGGTSVVITGTNLTGATAVNFGATSATTFTVNSATSITATSPAGSGTVDITVTTAGGTSATGAGDQFTYVAAPAVTGINPTSGSTAGGTVVTITGTGFTGATAVSFGGTAATTFSVTNSTTISATTAARVAGAGLNVSVTTPGGTNSANTFYTYAAPSAKLYYITQATGTPAVGDSLWVANTDGTGSTKLQDDNLIENPNALALDLSKHRAFVADSFGGQQKIYTIDLNGTAPVTPVLFYTMGTTPVGGLLMGGPNDMQVDLANGYLYYISTGGSGGTPASGDSLWRINLDGTNNALLFDASSIANASTLALDLPNHRIFVADSFAGQNKIYTVDLSGSFPATPVLFLTIGTAPVGGGPLGGPTCMRVDAAHNLLYYTTTGGSGSTAASGDTLWKVNLDGSGNGVVTDAVAANPNALALDIPNNRALVADSFNGQQALYSINLTTGEATSFISGINLTTHNGIAFAGPTVTTNAATLVTGSGATLNGTANAQNNPGVTVSFDYGTTTAYGTNVAATPSSVSGSTDTSVSAILTGLSAGTYHFRVNAGGVAGADQTFTTTASLPTVTSISPTSGPTAGGTPVVITGTNFTGATAVKFGVTNAAGFVVNSATSISATAPAGAGTVDVTVTTVGGTSATGAGDQFTYVPAPTVASISSTKANGSYNAAVLVPITVTFSAAVTVTGTPTLALNSGGSASYGSGSGTSTLTFNYTVGAIDNATLLDCSSTTALALAGGTINATTGGTAANLTLPTPGGANSLGVNKALVIDTTPPTITSIVRQNPTGQTTASNVVTFRVTYSEPVTVPGASNFSVVAVNGSSIVGTVTSVTGSGTTRDVTVTITSGTGEFRLRGVN